MPAAFRFAVKIPKTITHEPRADARPRAADALPRRDRRARREARAAARAAAAVVRVRAAARRPLLRAAAQPARRAGGLRAAPRDLDVAGRDALLRDASASPASPPIRRAPPGSRRRAAGAASSTTAGTDRRASYFSPYSDAAHRRAGAAIQSRRRRRWCIFDNTGSGSAAGNALDLTRVRLEPCAGRWNQPGDANALRWLRCAQPASPMNMCAIIQQP